MSDLEAQVAQLGEVGADRSTKAEKYTAVLRFAANKRMANGKVAVSPVEIKGCTGVSRRYAYDLVEAMADDLDGVAVREAQEVETGSGTTQKPKALLVDCDAIQASGGAVNEVTTAGTGAGVD